MDPVDPDPYNFTLPFKTKVTQKLNLRLWST